LNVFLQDTRLDDVGDDDAKYVQSGSNAGDDEHDDEDEDEDEDDEGAGDDDDDDGDASGRQ